MWQHHATTKQQANHTPYILTKYVPGFSFTGHIDYQFRGSGQHNLSRNNIFKLIKMDVFITYQRERVGSRRNTSDVGEFLFQLYQISIQDCGSFHSSVDTRPCFTSSPWGVKQVDGLAMQGSRSGLGGIYPLVRFVIVVVGNSIVARLVGLIVPK